MAHDIYQDFGHSIAQLYSSRRIFMRERLRDYGLIGAQHSLLIGIDRHPGASQDFFADYLGLDKGTVARSAQRLEERGYISREVPAENRRQYMLFLTKDGEKALDVAWQAINEWNTEITKRLSREEVVTVTELIIRMNQQP